ncbi:hypothetical protein [Arcticibacter sp.]|uniref:hypothetical protein n=1 Tax=Arcticibacter sp. TaxID=1872630 RepID=UPI00388EB10E
MKIKHVPKVSFLLLAAALFTSSCGNANHGKTAMTSGTTPPEEPLKGCYIAVIKRDTIQLAITEVRGNQINGSLVYNFWEKDRSKGTFTGEYKDDILSARYVFNAEGARSERPVIFKKVSEGFVEGFGETNTEQGREVFINPGAVNFEQSYTLKHTDICLP